jgi:hypothetical protein
MPALPAVPAVVRTDLQFTRGEDLAAKCRFFMKYGGTAPTNAQLVTLAGATSAAYSVQLSGLADVDTTLTQVTITDLSSSTSAIGVDTTPRVGTRTGGVLPADTCVLESRTVARRFRGGHSRIYWPFGTQPDLSDPQKWLSSFVTTCTTDLHAFGSQVEAAVWSGGASLTPVAVSYYQGFTVHTGVTGRARNVSTVRLVPVVDVLTSTIAKQGVASQRKRLLRLA